MKRIIALLTMLVALATGGICNASPVAMAATSTTGGAFGSVDSIPSVSLETGTQVIVTTSTGFCVYRYDATSSATESGGPGCDAENINKDDSLGTAGRWIKADIEASDLTATGNLVASGDMTVSGKYSSNHYQWNSMRAGQYLADTTQCKLMIMWESPADNGTEVDRCGSNTITYDDASNFTSTDRLTQGLSWMLDLDGTDDRVTVTADSSIDLGDGTNSYDFTIEFWFEAPAQDVGESTILRAQDAGGYDWFISHRNGGMRAWFRDQSGSVTAKQAILTTYFTEGQIYHVVITHDEAVGSASVFNDGTKTYINGVDITSTLDENTCVTGAICGAFVAIESGATLYIGADHNPASLLSTAIGDVVIYREALTANTIKAHYLAGKGFVCPN